MKLFYKRCDVCGNKIKKFENFKDILFGAKPNLICKKCGTPYKYQKSFDIIFNFLTYVWILTIFPIIYFLSDLLEILGLWAYPIALLISSIIFRILVELIPYVKNENSK
ncbi:hypothetical protein [Campylobacter concisus]|jgi:hypothetical protein